MRPQYRRRKRGLLALLAVSALVASGVATESLAARKHNATEVKTATPIKHLVIIFGENETFDHYFATYPVAANTEVPLFYAKDDTPSKAHPAVPGWSICSMRVPCAGDQRRAEGTWDG